METKQVKGFTLIELLIVIGIIAILATVVILTLNPAELLRQARDSNRISDLGNLKTAISFYLSDVANPLGSNGLGMGEGANCYASVIVTSLDAGGNGITTGVVTSTCGGRFSGGVLDIVVPTSSGNSRLVNGIGWIPINLNLISGAASPLSALPVDPVVPNIFGASIPLSRFYAYRATTSTLSFEVNAVLESTKFASSSETDGGNDLGLFEVGTYPGLSL